MTGGGEEAALGGVVGGATGVGGRNEELISPIPMKKSSIASQLYDPPSFRTEHMIAYKEQL